eukprot:scaffold74801_cov47-Prasinocladus_malaysianus.AAC.1
MVSDLAQLPSVCKHKLHDDELYCVECHPTSAAAWIESTPSTDQIEGYIGNNAVTMGDAMESLSADETVLCSHRKDTRDINNKVLDEFFPSYMIHAVRARLTSPTRTPRTHKVGKM